MQNVAVMEVEVSDDGADEKLHMSVTFRATRHNTGDNDINPRLIIHATDDGPENVAVTFLIDMNNKTHSASFEIPMIALRATLDMISSVK